MERTLEARIKCAAEKVIQLEHDLEVATEEYQNLVNEAHRRGVQVPRTVLTNPFMPRE